MCGLRLIKFVNSKIYYSGRLQQNYSMKHRWMCQIKKIHNIFGLHIQPQKNFRKTTAWEIPQYIHETPQKSIQGTIIIPRQSHMK